jgi:bifunctional DNase/RNase
MNLIQLLINGISYSQTQNGAYALILSEIEGERKLPIVIGTNEAQSIAIAIEKEIKPPRPLTHDLFKNFCIRFDIKIKQVIIHKLVDGVFYSSVICERDGIEEIIDSRSSDAIALAIRFEAPIYTYENILEKAGVVIQVETEIEEKSLLKELFSEQNSEITNSDLKEKSIKELEDLLKHAVQNENYESAAKIRDEISNR